VDTVLPHQMSSEKSCEFFLLFRIDRPSIILKKNEFGNYEHSDTHFIFSRETKDVIGKQNPDGTIDGITEFDVGICTQMKIVVSEAATIIYDKKEEDDRIKVVKAEKEYKDMLIELFVSKWSKKFEGKTEMTSYGLSNCKIRNIHGLEFYGYEIIYTPNLNDYIIEFYTGKTIDGITPPDDESEIFILQSGGSDIKKAFSTVLDYINKYIFCKHCGVIRQFDSYSEKHDRCGNCLITEILMLGKKHGEVCTICMESTKNYYTLRCGHKFHRSCLSDLEVKVCPNCRKYINEEDGEYAGE